MSDITGRCYCTGGSSLCSMGWINGAGPVPWPTTGPECQVQCVGLVQHGCYGQYVPWIRPVCRQHCASGTGPQCRW